MNSDNKRRALELLISLGVFIFGVSNASAMLNHDRQTIEIPMADTHTDTSQTVKLAADLYLPKEGGPDWPAILVQTPYVKELTYLRWRDEHADDPLFLSPDYAWVMMDWRGFGVSGSQDMAYAGAPSNGEDGYQAVEWIAAQAWCSGPVGTWGQSALGHVQMRTAAEQPPHLVCCVPIVYQYRQAYEIAYPGGVYARNRNDFAYGAFGGLQTVRNNPLENIVWDFAADQLSVEPINVPMLHISGWYDHDTPWTIAEFQAVQADGGTSATGRQKLLIGPWSHDRIGSVEQNELEYPAAKWESSIEALRFFDRYLRGVENGWEERPAVRYFQTNEDRWLDAPDWPPSDAAEEAFYLRADGALAGDAPTSTDAALEYIADPADFVPSVCGALLGVSPYGEPGPADISSLESRDDVLVFTTEERVEPLRLRGEGRAEIWIECDAADTDIALRLAQVWPDGRSMWLTDGIRRASLRNGFRAKETVPGGPVMVPVELPPLAVTIPAGHRLRMLVQPSNYDRYDYNLQDGSDLSDQDGGTTTTANIRLLVNTGNPSRLFLPVAPPDHASDANYWALH